MYGLRLAPIDWYIKIDSYFNAQKFGKCPHKPNLFFKHVSKGKIFIVSLYLDDLIITGNAEELIEAFKRSMREKFVMNNLGK